MNLPIALSVCIAMTGSGCVGGDADEGEDPVEYCHNWITQICTRYHECAPGFVTSIAECERTLFQNVFDCETHATGIGENYDTCLEQLETASCEFLVPEDADGSRSLDLPEDCGDAIILE